MSGINWDKRVPGLGVRANRWIVKYRFRDQQRIDTIGSTDELKVDDARLQAMQIKHDAKIGLDPRREKAPAASTIAELAAQFERVHLPLLKPGSVKNYKGLMRNHVLPRFGDRLVADIRPADIRQWKVDYVDTPNKFNKARDLMAQMMDYAIENELIAANPVRVHRLKNYPERGRKRYLTLNEAPRLGNALREYGKDSDTRWRFSAFITLLLLTGCRASEIAKARWEWINWDEAKIDWPDTKTGADQLYLAPPAVDLLRELHRRVPGNPYVIAGARIGQPIAGYAKMWREVCRIAGIENLRVHDLRKSFASIALAEGLGLDVIAGLLRHSNPAITAERYAFLMDEERKAAAEKTAAATLARLH